MLDVTTTIQEYIDFLKSRSACDSAIPYLEATITPSCVYMKDLTTSIDKGETSYAVGWSQWTLQDHGDQMTPALQLCFIKRITRPMAAFVLYRDYILSDEADTELIKLFKGKLITAEQQLRDGITQRKKQ